MTVACAPVAIAGRAPGSAVIIAYPAHGEAMRHSESEPWEALLAAANAGDGRAFARFLRLATPAIRKVIRAKAGSLPHDRQEDILQDVLIAIHLKRHTWHPGAPVRPWVHAIARYKAIDALRRGAAQPVHLPIDAVPEICAPPIDDAPGGAHDCDDRTLDALLARIDDRSARLVRAVALNGETTETAGARLGLRAGAARVALHRAIKKLTALYRSDTR